MAWVITFKSLTVNNKTVNAGQEYDSGKKISVEIPPLGTLNFPTCYLDIDFVGDSSEAGNHIYSSDINFLTVEKPDVSGDIIFSSDNLIWEVESITETLNNSTQCYDAVVRIAFKYSSVGKNESNSSKNGFIGWAFKYKNTVRVSSTASKVNNKNINYTQQVVSAADENATITLVRPIEAISYDGGSKTYKNCIRFENIIYDSVRCVIDSAPVSYASLTDYTVTSSTSFVKTLNITINENTGEARNFTLTFTGISATTNNEINLIANFSQKESLYNSQVEIIPSDIYVDGKKQTFKVELSGIDVHNIYEIVQPNVNWLTVGSKVKKDDDSDYLYFAVNDNYSGLSRSTQVEVKSYKNGDTSNTKINKINITQQKRPISHETAVWDNYFISYDTNESVSISLILNNETIYNGVLYPINGKTRFNLTNIVKDLFNNKIQFSDEEKHYDISVISNSTNIGTQPTEHKYGEFVNFNDTTYLEFEVYINSTLYDIVSVYNDWSYKTNNDRIINYPIFNEVFVNVPIFFSSSTRQSHVDDYYSGKWNHYYEDYVNSCVISQCKPSTSSVINGKTGKIHNVYPSIILGTNYKIKLFNNPDKGIKHIKFYPDISMYYYGSQYISCISNNVFTLSRSALQTKTSYTIDKNLGNNIEMNIYQIRNDIQKYYGMLYYLNPFGGIDWLPVKLQSKESRNITNTSVKYKPDYTSQEFEDYNYTKDITSTWQFKTDSMDDEQSKRMQYLLESQQVYLLKINNITDRGEDELIPINITDSKFDIKTFKNNNRKLIYYTFNAKTSKHRNIFNNL